MISMMILLIVFAVVAAIAFNEVRENQGHNDERNIFSRIWRNKDHRGNTAIINSIQTYVSDQFVKCLRL